nr:S24/S26 family peptidase [uncultured Ruminococcus sp.]
MSDRIPPEVFVDILRQSFERGQDIIFTPTGTSMLPMLDGKTDKVVFSPPPEKLKKYDVAFYRRKRTGQLVLHRMVGFDKNGGYVFSGDNQYYYEYGVGEEDIIALMTGFIRGDKRHETTELSYRCYIHKMMLKKRLRIFALKVYRILKKPR